MNLKRLIVAFVLTVFTFCTQANAQDKIVTGKVADANGVGLSGITIKTKAGKSLGATNADGTFTVKVPANSTLSFSSVGFTQVDMQVPANGEMTVLLKSKNDNLNEVVVIGYGSAKKKDLTGSVATVTSKDFVKGALTTPEQMIAGKVAGVSVVANDGTPGSGSVIRIRGGASVNASNDPLLIIDDVPVGNSSSFGLINPNDVESFTVLKDASASAIYGSRASNGVIIVKTKRGKSGKASFSFNSVTSVYTPAKYLDVMNADQFRTYVNANGTAAQKALLGNANTDWQREIYSTALGFDNTIAVSGTHKKVPYRASLGYLNQQGILDGGNLKRTTISLSANPKFFQDHLRVDINVKGSVAENKFANTGAVGAAVTYDPTQPVFSGNNRFNGYREWINQIDQRPFGTTNPVGLLNAWDSRSHVERSIGNIQFDYKFHFLPDLRMNVNFGYDASRDRGTTIVNDSARAMYRNSNIDVAGQPGVKKGGLRSNGLQHNLNTLMDAYLNYVKETKAGRFDLMAGYSYQNFKWTNFAFNTYTFDNTMREDAPPVFSQSTDELTLIGYYARFNYSYKGKYLLTASVRRDGSSRFAPSTRWATFPSFAAAWRIKEESFLRNTSWIDELKIRAGYGLTGQQEGLSLYDYLPRYAVGGNQSMYQFGNTFINTYSPQKYYPRRWEETQMANVAVDFGLFKNRLTGTLEYYDRTTKYLLNSTNLPGGANFGSAITGNVGEMKSSGFEVTLNLSVIRKKDMTLDLGFNANYNQNEITSLSAVADPSNPGNKFGSLGDVGRTPVAINSVGFNRGMFFVYKQIYDKAGRPIEDLVEDLNRDGKITADGDQYRYKQIDPIVFFGFSPSFTYKKFNAGFTMRASYGNYMFNALNARTANLPSVIVQIGSDFLANTTTNILSTNFRNNNLTSVTTDYFVENASFIRMDNINVGYNVGKLFNNKANLRVGVNVQNVFVITKYSGLDPEVFGGIDNTNYARPRVFALSMNLDF